MEKFKLTDRFKCTQVALTHRLENLPQILYYTLQAALIFMRWYHSLRSKSVSPNLTTQNSSSPTLASCLSAANNSGGSLYLSSDMIHVPQCTPMLFFALISWCIFIASRGPTCCIPRCHSGSYEPMGIAARSIGPYFAPISLNTSQYPVSPQWKNESLMPLTTKEHHRVLFVSNGVRALQCYGMSIYALVPISDQLTIAGVQATLMCGASRTLVSCHQSNSTTRCTPFLANHCRIPTGTYQVTEFRSLSTTAASR